MPDPLSVAASIISITVPALYDTRLLVIIDAPQAIQSLKDDVASAEMALQSLQAIKDPEWEVLGQTVAGQSKAASKNCARVCGVFRDNLQSWTRHSQEGKMSWQDRAKTISIKEAEIFKVITSTNTQLIEVDSSLGEIHLTNSTHEQGPKEEDVRNVVKQIEEERVALDCSRKLLKELLLKVQEDAVARACEGCQDACPQVSRRGAGSVLTIV
ncbi:hypothetical protein FGG08_000621 [Glutinoglossum americanum]|uniref:Azaphilone pigments biosynthesis cluster protein L N-terminal domain-containing protein n=1 Tax=Glutinoglossum americanum TaxID=1670608 RepID=A0A9P8L6S3_9PEZI|nr:hypothetical protein FGG08_000621 [Glutinoglossum americanum]